MKATIHTELRCGLCGQMMQYHQDVKVRCVQLRCKERNKEYHAPSVELYPAGKVMPVDMEGREAEHFYKDEREMVTKSEGKKRGRPKTIKD